METTTGPNKSFRGPSTSMMKKSNSVLFARQTLTGNDEDAPKLNLRGLERSLSTLDNSKDVLKKPFHSEYILPKASSSCAAFGEDQRAKLTRSYSALPASALTGSATPSPVLSRKTSKAQMSFRGVPGGSSFRSRRSSSIRSFGSNDDGIFEADTDLEGKDDPLWRDSFLPKVLQLKGFKANLEPYGVDYIGGGTFQVSQFNLLAKRSVEPIRSNEGQLSARGLHHRSREQFEKEVKSSSHVISNAMRGRMGPATISGSDPSYTSEFQLLPVYFQRALAHERLNEVDKAIADYNTAISIDRSCAPAYFNRAGLLNTKGDLDGAIRDVTKAVEIDPANMTYRRNRIVLLRLKGDYSAAIQDAMICRAVKLQPSLAKELKAGNVFPMDSEQLLVNFKGPPPKDPIIEVLSLPFDKRTTEQIATVVDFLVDVKYLQSFSTDRIFLKNLAMKAEVKTFRKGEYVYRELERSRIFYIVLEGEVSLVVIDSKKVLLVKDDDVSDDEPLRYLSTVGKAGSFGETALEIGAVLRPTGAVCIGPTTVIAIEGTRFQSMYSKYKSMLREEVRVVLNDCEVFRGWEDDVLDRLAAGATVKKFKAGSTVMKAGDQVTHLHIIRSGVVRVMKSMDKPQLCSSSSSNSNNANSQSGQQYSASYGRFSSSPRASTAASALSSSPERGGRDRDTRDSRDVVNFPGPHTARSTMSGQTVTTAVTANTNSSSSVKTNPFIDEVLPGLWVREKNWKGLLETFAHEVHEDRPDSAWPATVGVLGTGQFFGEMSILNPDRKNNGPQSITTIVAFTDAEVFLIDSAVMIAAGARFKAPTMNSLNDSFNLFNPPDDKIFYYMKYKFDWEKKRGKIIASVMKDKKNPT